MSKQQNKELLTKKDMTQYIKQQDENEPLANMDE